MNKKNNIIAMVVTIACFAFAGCQTSVNNNTAANANTVSTSNMPTADTVANTAPAAVAGTPTEAYNAAYAARKNKDVPALKKLLSKDILEFFTEISGVGEKKQTLDELLMELCEKPQAPTAEVRNEKINGDKATIEYLDEKGGWSPMDFIKEDGAWKLTIEKPDPSELEVPQTKNGKG